MWDPQSGELLGTPPGLPHQRLQDLTRHLDVGELSGTQVADSSISAEEDARHAVKQLERATPEVEKFRSEAKKAQAFHAGDQVDEIDRQLLSDEGRPVVTLNATQKFIRIVDGIERRVPLAIYYLPRDPSDEQAAGKAELRSKIKEALYEKSEYAYEVARAKHDRNVTGMGWMETYVSRSSDPAGQLETVRFSPMEAVWPKSSRENLKGVRWVARERETPVELAIVKFPHVSDVLRAAAGSEGAPKDYPIKADLIRYRVPWTMTEPTNKGGKGPAKPDEVRITDFQYAKPTAGYYFKDPVLTTMQWLPTKEFDAYSRRLRTLMKLLPANVEPVTKDVYWRLFLLNRSFLLDGPTKMPIDGFSLNCVTGDWDDKRGVWYGMIRMFMDPQLLVDKCAGSAVEILGAQTKGGLIYEVGAMSDTQAEDYKETGAQPGSVNQVKRNALAEHRIMFKPQPEVPSGVASFMEFGLTTMSNISGISESILQPDPGTGVGLRQRLSIGLLLLASYFDSSVRFERKLAVTTQGFMRLLADDRWIRIGGKFDAQFVQMVRDDYIDDYDLTVDDTEQDPTLWRLWEERVMSLAPTLIKTNNFIPDILDYVKSLPAQFRMKLKQAIQRNSQQQMQMRMMGIAPGGRGKQRTLDEIKADTLKTKSQGALNFAKAAHSAAQAKELGAGRLHDDIKTLFDGLIASHKQDIEREKIGIEHRRLQIEAARPMPQGRGA